jgi:outer membrane protein assembly factor BamB
MASYSSCRSRAMARRGVQFVSIACAGLGLALGLQSAHGQDAVAFQINAAHSGNIAMKGFKPPLQLLWTQKLQGTPISYPLIANGLVFVTSNARVNNDYLGTYLYAISASDGQVVWRRYIYHYDGTFGDGWSNATYDNGQVFTLDRFGVLTACDALTGHINWSQLEGPYDEPLYSAPPTASQGQIYMGSPETGLLGISETDGSQLWTGAAIDQSGAPAVGDNGVYVIDPCHYAKFQTSDGKTLWSDGKNCGGGGSTPVFSGSDVVVREPSRQYPNSILDAGTGAKLGTFAIKGANVVPALFSDAGGRFLVYNTGTTLDCYDVTDPSAITTVWSKSFSGQRLSSPPIVINHNVVQGTASGDVYLLSSAKGKILWHTNVGLPVADPQESGGPRPVSGMGAGDGILVIPAGDPLKNEDNWALFAFAPTSTAAAVESHRMPSR